MLLLILWLIPVAMQSKLYVCGCSIAWIVGLNPSDSMDVKSHVCCVVGETASVISWSLFQRSPSGCVCVCV
jgi:hypothetical protein